MNFLTILALRKGKELINKFILKKDNENCWLTHQNHTNTNKSNKQQKYLVKIK